VASIAVHSRSRRYAHSRRTISIARLLHLLRRFNVPVYGTDYHTGILAPTLIEAEFRERADLRTIVPLKIFEGRSVYFRADSGDSFYA